MFRYLVCELDTSNKVHFALKCSSQVTVWNAYCHRLRILEEVLITFYFCVYILPSADYSNVCSGVIGYTVRPNFRSGGPYSLREYGPPRTQLPREYGPSKILYIQGIQSGGGGGLNSLIEWRFDFDDPVYSVYN